MPKTFLFLFSSSFIIGLVCKAIIDLNLDIYLLAIIVLFFIYLLSQFKLKVIALIIFLFSFSAYSFVTETPDLQLARVQFKAWVCALPSASLNSQGLILCPLDLKDNSQIIIYTEIFPKYFYGDVLLIKGELKQPEFIEDFNYPEYLARNSIYRTISFAEEINLASEKKGNPILRRLYFYRQKMITKLNQRFSEPQAGLLKAMILGERKAISQEIVENFKLAGLSHLVAVSGSHLSMVALSFLIFGFFLHIRRQNLVYPLIIFLWVYLILVGFRPSALRATIMSSLALLALKRGRLPEPLSILSFTAALSLIINHYYLLDIAWQLSFLALYAIVNFISLTRELLIKTNFLRSIGQTFLLTLSIQLLLWPILVWHFGGFSLAGLVSNLLIYFAFPILIALLSVFLISPLDFVSPSLNLLANYFISIADFISQFSFLYLEFNLNSYPFLIAYYSALLFIISQLKKRLRK